MKTFKIVMIGCMLILFGSSAYAKPPHFVKGSEKDLEQLKGETMMDLKFDYAGMTVSKVSEKEWLTKQKMKDVEDEKRAVEEFNKYWFGEIRENQEECFAKWYNDNCKNMFRVSKGATSKYTMTVKSISLFPYNNFGQIAVLTTNIIITETATQKVIVIIEQPNMNSGVPALKERVGLAYGGSGKAYANFINESLGNK